MDPTPINRPASGGDTFAQLSFDAKTNDALIALRSSEGWLDTIRLSTGRICAIKAPTIPLCDHHFLVYFPSCQGSPDSPEKQEMIQIVMRLAEQKAQEILGNPEAYTIIHNGRATVSFPDTHFLVPLEAGYLWSRWRRATSHPAPAMPMNTSCFSHWRRATSTNPTCSREPAFERTVSPTNFCLQLFNSARPANDSAVHVSRYNALE